MKRQIESIVIGDRFRKDMGDIPALAADIEKLALLTPIIVTEDNELVDGARRIQACKSLGWTDIDVHVVSIPSIMDGELSANEMRKRFTPSERKAITHAILKRLQQEHPQGRPKKVADRPPSQNGKKIRDVAAKAAGLGSATTMRRVDFVEQSGRADILEAMNKGELSIDRAAREVGYEEKKKTRARTLPAPPKPFIEQEECSQRMLHVLEYFQNSFIGRENVNTLLRMLKKEKRKYAFDRLVAIKQWLCDLDEVQFCEN